VLITILIIMFEMGYFMHVTERLETPEFRLFENCLWFTFITMTTVGYGDINVQSETGKIVAAMGGILGILVVSLLIAVVIDLLMLTEDQNWAVNWVSTQISIEKEKVHACQYLQACTRYYLYVVNFESKYDNAKESEKAEMLKEKKRRSASYYTTIVNKMKAFRLARSARTFQEDSSCSDIEIYHKELATIRSQVKNLEHGLDRLLILMDEKGIPKSTNVGVAYAPSPKPRFTKV